MLMAETEEIVVTETTTVTQEVTVTPAHHQSQTLRVLEWYPQHLPRETDPHYHFFHEAQKRLRAAGKLVCWVCGHDEATSGHPIELHHSRVEFALANGVDLDKFIEAYPEFGLVHGDEEAFLAWIESESNLLALCKLHHTGPQGIHCLPYPIWQALKYWRDDLPVPGQSVGGGPVAQ